MRAAAAPWMAVLRNRAPHPAAGAVLIAGRWLLTAAHASSFAEALVGGAPVGGARVIAVVRSLRRLDYDRGSGAHDLALLELAEPAGVEPVGLAPGAQQEAGEIVKGGRRLEVLGWRIESAPPAATLRRRWARVVAGPGRMPPGSFATEPVTRPGDSGGPVIARSEGRTLLVGIVAQSGRGAGHDLHTSVAAHREWIEGVIRGERSDVRRGFVSRRAAPR